MRRWIAVLLAGLVLFSGTSCQAMPGPAVADTSTVASIMGAGWGPGAFIGGLALGTGLPVLFVSLSGLQPPGRRGAAAVDL